MRRASPFYRTLKDPLGVIRQFWNAKHIIESTYLYRILNLLKAITHGIRLVDDLEKRIAHWGLMQ